MSRRRLHTLVVPMAKIAMQDRRGSNRQTVCDAQPLCPVMAAHPAASLGRVIYHHRRHTQVARVDMVIQAVEVIVLSVQQAKLRKATERYAEREWNCHQDDYF